jgi:hypothetical protein
MDPSLNFDSDLDSDLDLDVNSDLDLDLFQAPIETPKPTNLFQSTLRFRMDVTQASLSPSGVNFMPSSPPPDASGIVPWPNDLIYEFIRYLEDSTNWSVLNSTKRNTI